MEFQHVAIRVADLAKSRQFYEEGLGLSAVTEFTTDEGIHNYYVGGEGRATVQLTVDPTTDEPIEPAGVRHLAMLVEDVDATVKRLFDVTGCPVTAEPETYDEYWGARAAFVEDPDGYEVELYDTLPDEA